MALTTNVSKTFKGDGYQIAVLSTMWAASRTLDREFTAYTQHHLDICKDISQYVQNGTLDHNPSPNSVL